MSLSEASQDEPVAPDRGNAEEPAKCPLCGHSFNPGRVGGNIYCAKCGRRFNPKSSLEETVSIPAPGENPPPELLDENPSGEIEGKRFGDYDILEEIARGGMGVVYRARQHTLKRIVALKVLRGGDGATDEELARFMREAKAAASLNHPNIVPIHELSAWQGKHFFTMDFIEGIPLDQMIDREPLTPNHACEMVDTIARAIEYAHTRGIIHRDLKPANIIIDTEGRPMLTDFGLAVNLASDVRSQRMTRTGAVMGTIPYIPPEQAAGHIEDVDERSDVYSLGAVMYEMLCGRPPFQGETQFELLRRVINNEALPPRKINQRIHPDVETICLKCLEKDPGRRYSSAQELADDCRRFLHGEVITARPATLCYRITRLAGRYKPLVAAGVCVMILLIALFGYRRSWHKLYAEREQAENTVKLLELKAKASGAELEKGWQKAFTTDSEGKLRFAPLIHNAFRSGLLWCDVTRTAFDKTGTPFVLSGLPDNNSPRGLSGIPIPFTGDFDMSCLVRVPEKNAASLVIVINADSRFEYHEGAYAVMLGVAGKPGAKLLKGVASINEKPNFVIDPGAWRRVRVLRKDNKLSVTVDGLPLLSADATAINPDAKQAYLAFSAYDGKIALDQISVAVRGLSHANIEGLLELAGSLSQEREFQMALKLYERVALEKNTSAIDHITAIRGYCKALSLYHGKNTNQIAQAVENLFQKMKVSRDPDPGEKGFAMGLALCGPNRSDNIEVAIKHFRVSGAEALPPDDSLIPYGSCEVLGPFSGDDTADAFDRAFIPVEEYPMYKEYSGIDGKINWTKIGNPDIQGESIHFVPDMKASPNNSAYYVRRVFTTGQPTPVTIHTGSDDGISVWLNGELLFKNNLRRGLSANQEQVDANFIAGRNIVVIKVNNHSGPSGFWLRVIPKRKAEPGMYGRLARLEEALLRLRVGDVNGAVESLRTMQADGNLHEIAAKYPTESNIAGALPTVLEKVDIFLKRADQLDAALGILEAMRELYPNAKEDLATRYLRLASAKIAVNELESADSALLMAINLAPGWYRPRVSRALLFAANGKELEAGSELADAMRELPENLELHLAAAEFYLASVDGVPRNVILAQRISTTAIRISERLDPTAWRLNAKALLADQNFEDARDSIMESINLQEKPNQEDLLMLQMINKALGITSEQEKDAAHATVIKSNEP